jgi:uncharacterized SAM-binding protein YcdF (DUF218 family)
MLKKSRIIRDITDFVFVSDEPARSDIIFLPGSSRTEIPETAARLYAEKYAPLILPTGNVSIKSGRFGGVKSKKEIYNKNYETECAFYTDVLVSNGVPESAIWGEDKSTYTKENAVFSRRVTDEHNLVINSAIICCRAFHARRCLMYYQLEFPEADIMIVPVDCDEELRKDNWFLNEYGVERILGELSRCGSQFMIDAYFPGKILEEE